MTDAASDEVREAVRRSYAAIVSTGGNSGCCAPPVHQVTGAGAAPSCCGGGEAAAVPSADDFARAFGYSDGDLAAVPDGANMGLGCGNPAALAALKAGEVVVDLGAGGGFDCFLAAGRIGASGRVIGVDMTPEMVARARDNARKVGAANVEFRLGEIEHLPVADGTADAVISNCVLNLSPDKPRVIAEMFRVLKPGGRVAISDVVATADLPAAIRADERLLCGCVGGAAPVAELEAWLAAAGFIKVWIEVNEDSRETIKDWAPGSGVERFVASASIAAVKPPPGCGSGCGGG